MARKGRARRFREARQLKQGYDDGLFSEGSGTLADVAEVGDAVDSDGLDAADAADDEAEDDDSEADEFDWDPDRQR